MDSLRRIDNNVHENLFKLAGISPDEGQKGIEFLDDLNVVEKGLIFQKEEAIGDRAIDIRGLHFRLGLASKFKKALDDLFATAGLLDDSCQIPSFGILFWKVLHHEAGIDQNTSKRVV